MCYICVQLYAYVTNCYVCVQLCAYVTHGNVNVLCLRTSVRICNIWTISTKHSYDMYETYTYVTPVLYMKPRSLFRVRLLWSVCFLVACFYLTHGPTYKTNVLASICPKTEISSCKNHFFKCGNILYTPLQAIIGPIRASCSWSI